jgi:hypothetical protein
MSKNEENHPHSGAKMASYSVKMTFPLPFALTSSRNPISRRLVQRFLKHRERQLPNFS